MELRILVLAALMAVVVYLFWRRNRRRKAAIVQACATRGWTYVPRDDRLIERWAGSPFQQGFGRRTSGVVQGVDAKRPFTTFTYHYKTEQADGEGQRTTANHTYCVLAVETGARMPELDVKPENVLTRAFGRLTNSDIQLESDTFNRAFSVSCSDRRFASDVLHPRLMEALLAVEEQVPWRLQGSDLLVVANTSNSIEQIDRALATAHLVLDSIPAFLWQDLTGEPVPPTG